MADCLQLISGSKRVVAGVRPAAYRVAMQLGGVVLRRPGGQQGAVVAGLHCQRNSCWIQLVHQSTVACQHPCERSVLEG